MTHFYDGTLNDGFCAVCGQSREQGDHLSREVNWDAYHRSRRIRERIEADRIRFASRPAVMDTEAPNAKGRTRAQVS